LNRSCDDASQEERKQDERPKHHYARKQPPLRDEGKLDEDEDDGERTHGDAEREEPV